MSFAAMDPGPGTPQIATEEYIPSMIALKVFTFPGEVPVSDETVLSGLQAYSIMENQVIAFVPDAAEFFAARDGNALTFDTVANDRVRQAPELALAAHLAGAKLDETNLAQALDQLRPTIDQIRQEIAGPPN